MRNLKRLARVLYFSAGYMLGVVLLLILLLPFEVMAADNKLLWLVNPNNPLEPAYRPEFLIKVDGYLIRPEAGEAFLKMLADMKADGITNMHLQSAYRPYAYQSVLFDEKVEKLCEIGYEPNEANVIAARSVAIPGGSEHQIGLATDVSVDGKLSVDFGTTEAGIWLRNNCDRYGYILRYPADKTSITKIVYEPWHLRYVGIPHAAFMNERNLCLEEYIDLLKEAKILLYWIDEESYYKLSFSYELPENAENYSSLGYDPSCGYVVTELKKFQR